MNRIDKLEKATGDHRYALQRIEELEKEMVQLRKLIVDINLHVRKLEGREKPSTMPRHSYEVSRDRGE